MPYSLVLNLLPLSSIPLGYLSGRHLHALFLNLVSSVDRQLGNYLHQSQGDKAFTLSPLQISPRYRENLTKPSLLKWQYSSSIPQNTSCWWRVSLLDESLFGQLTHLWLNLNPNQPWHLGPADLKITSILGTLQSCQPWANTCSYEELYQEASDSDRNLKIIFATPTAFRNANYDTALPTPELVFNSLRRRWNKYSPIEIDSIAVESIYPSFFELRSEIVADSRSKFIGCVGEITYRILGEVEPLQIKQINTLADFALYGGIGRKTTMGMGMARRIQQSK